MKTMKRCALKFTGVLVVALGAASPFSPVEAGPSTSPSARQAARLKHNPPRGWIRHYLPDDRYKILGGTWKYVSTELDRFYYPAWAPEMLRRPAGRVIGFASGQDAEEAGYMPAAGYAGINPGFDRATAAKADTTGGTLARRVRLADGSSTILVPGGWRHMGNQRQTQNGVTINSDMFMPPGGKGMVMVMTMNLPNLPVGTDIGTMLRSGNLQNVISRANSRGPINNRLSNALNNISSRPATLGGLRGVALTPKTMVGSGMPQGAQMQALVAGRGSKVYILMGQSPGRPPAGYTQLVRSFQPR
jgi:hypothetical protein